MALNLDGLADYIKDNANNIVTEAVLGFTSKQYVTLQPGIKSSENITKLVTEASLVAGACGWSPTGTTTLSKRNLAVSPYKSQEALCSEDFNRTFLQVLANAGSIGEDIALEETYVDAKIAAINRAFETKLWSEETEFNGFLALVGTDDESTPGADDGVPAVNKIARTTSVMDDIDRLLPMLPAGALAADGLYVYMSRASYLSLGVELREKNLFHHASGDQQAMLMNFPGTNIQCVGITGMGSNEALILGNKANFFAGTDMSHDFESAMYEYDKFEDEHRFSFKAKLGAQIAIPSEVVAAV